MTSHVTPKDGLRFAFALLAIAAAAIFVGLSASSASAADDAVKLEGTLQVAHSDDFVDKRTVTRYALRTKQRTLKLSLGSGRAATRIRRAAPNSRIVVRGKRRGTSLSVESSAVTAGASAKATAAASKPARKAVVVLIKFDNNADPYSADTARTAVFKNVNTYYSEQSEGDVTFSGIDRADGDVFGAYKVSKGSGCASDAWSNSARQQAEAEHGALSRYDNIVYLFPKQSSCGWAGMGGIGWGVSWINGTTTVRVIGHEIGHNLGLHHANAYNCTQNGKRVAVGGSCTSQEYGDPFDIMGSSDRHFNVWNKGRLASLGLFPAMQTQTASQTGSYTLSPITPGTPGVQAIRVLKSGSGTGAYYYYLETRKMFGVYEGSNLYPNSLGGVTIRIAKQYGTNPSNVEQTQLVDTTPETATFGDAKLLPGKTFTDPAANVSITNVAQDSNNVATLQIAADGSTPTVDPPKQLRAGSTREVIVLNWEPSGYDLSGPLDHAYNVYRDGVKVHSSTDVTYRSYVDSNAVQGRTYTYWVTAVDDAGFESVASNQATAKLLEPEIGNPPPPPPSGSAPVVTIANPVEGAVVKGTVKVQASAADDKKVTRIELWADGKRIFARGTSAMTRGWNVGAAKYKPGAHTLVVKAYDADGNVGTATRNVTK